MTSLEAGNNYSDGLFYVRRISEPTSDTKRIPVLNVPFAANENINRKRLCLYQGQIWFNGKQVYQLGNHPVAQLEEKTHQRHCGT
jgi:hypothetical protein